MGPLRTRVERLEGRTQPSTTCATCDGAGPVAFLGIPEEEPLPSWIDESGRCRDCRRFVRVYRGVDLALV